MHYMSYKEAEFIMWSSFASWCAVYVCVGILGVYLYRNMTGARFNKAFNYHFWVVLLPAFLEVSTGYSSPAQGMLGCAGAIYWSFWLFILAIYSKKNQDYNEAYKEYLHNKVNELPPPDDKILKRYEYHNGFKLDRFGQIYWWREDMFKKLSDPFECARLVKEGRIKK